MDLRWKARLKRRSPERHYSFVRFGEATGLPHDHSTKEPHMKDVNVTPAQAVQSQIFIHARESKLLIWTEVERGGCIQTKGQLEMRSDGSGTWSCVTASRNPFPGDVWHTHFAVMDRNGTTLFGAGPFYSPRMFADPNGREHRWSASFTFPAHSFGAIHAAVQTCGTLPPVCAINVSARQTAPGQIVAEDVWQRATMSLALGVHA